MKLNLSKSHVQNFCEKISLLAPYQIILAAFFLCGSIIGSCTAFALDYDSIAKFSQISLGQAVLDRNALNPRLLLFGSLKYTLIIFLLSLFILGIFIIPLTAAAKGFSLSLCISCFYRAAGIRGLSASAAALLGQNIIMLPLFFIFAAQAAVLSKNMLVGFLKTRRICADPPPYYFIVFCMCLLSGLLSCLFEAFAVPYILSAFFAH